MPIQSKNPATEEVVKTFDEISDQELEGKLDLGKKAFDSWRQTSFEHRAKLMEKMVSYLQEHKQELANLATLEMGKTITAATAEVDKCTLTCQYYAKNAETFLANEIISTESSESYVQFEPLGVILAVMPWNFPYWQVYRAAAPALMAGNTMILKHASNVPQCAIAMEKAFLDCGFPEGVFQNLLLGSARVEKVIRNANVAAVTLTGSEKAGSEVAKVAGSEIKKTVLELGGSDPFIVLEDADVKSAAETAVKTRMQVNAGQSCISAKRFIVHKSVAEQFTAALVNEFSKLKIGDPILPETTVGPLVNEQALAEVTRQVDESVKMGAQTLLGGKRWGSAGYFFEPTVIANVSKDMPVFNEEVFGPVAPVIIVADEAEAVAVANDTRYGLSSTIFTKDISKAKKLASQIEAGSVFINDQVRSDARLPFGGIKKSGYGRELSIYGIKEFVNIKTIVVK